MGENRLHGTWPGVGETARRDLQRGEAWGGPGFQGDFAGVRRVRAAGPGGPLTLRLVSPEMFRCGGPPRIIYINI